MPLRSMKNYTNKKTMSGSAFEVYIENQPVLGDGAGAGALNVCRSFAAQHVSNPAAPVVKVCGIGMSTRLFISHSCHAQ